MKIVTDAEIHGVHTRAIAPNTVALFNTNKLRCTDERSQYSFMTSVPCDRHIDEIRMLAKMNGLQLTRIEMEFK